MQVDGRIIEVWAGDSVYTPRQIKHQMINSSEQWVEQLLLTCWDNDGAG